MNEKIDRNKQNWNGGWKRIDKQRNEIRMEKREERRDENKTRNRIEDLFIQTQIIELSKVMPKSEKKILVK